MTDDDVTTKRIVLLLWGALLGGLAWIARTLSATDDLPPLRRFAGGILGSCLATFSTGALALHYLDADPLFLIGMAGPIGWLGGDALNGLARFVLKQVQRS